ncbi:MAG: phosphate-starvation-inducible PsiE family protein [Steroidobacteraceae bacterium]
MTAIPSWLSADRLNAALQRLILISVQIFLLVVIVLAVVVLGMLAYNGISSGMILSIDSAPEFQMRVQNAFGGALLVLLGLELLETVRTYFAEHRIRLEVIMIVAMIAVSRHIITIDFEHADGLWLLGVSALVIALGAAYYLVKRSTLETIR